MDKRTAVIYTTLLLFALEEGLASEAKANDEHNMQYHVQDNLGQYRYGFKTPHTTKQESRSIDGKTSGSYSFTDPNGVLQTVNYEADPTGGFRVTTKNDQKVSTESDTKKESVINNKPNKEDDISRKGLKEQIKLDLISKTQTDPYKDLAILQKSRIPETHQISFNPAAISIPFLVPKLVPLPRYIQIPFIYFPIIDYTPTILQKSFVTPYTVIQPGASDYIQDKNYQYFGRNLYGEYDYGYGNTDSAKYETKTADGVTRGGYSYRDSNGELQAVSYEAGKDQGFQVVATNLPKSHF